MLAEVIYVPQNQPCYKCVPCVRMRLMELGFVNGVDINIQEKTNGMYIVNMLSEKGHIEQTVALRKEEMDRVCYKLK